MGGFGVNCHLEPFRKLLKTHTLNPKITIWYQFYDRKALFEIPKFCNINFWIENAPTLLWHFPENSSDLVAGPFPHTCFNCSTQSVCCTRLGLASYGQTCCHLPPPGQLAVFQQQKANFHVIWRKTYSPSSRWTLVVVYGYTVNKYHFLMYLSLFFR